MRLNRIHVNSLTIPAEADRGANSDDHLLVAISVSMSIRSSAVTQPHLHLPPFVSWTAGYERRSLINLEEEEEWRGQETQEMTAKQAF